MIPENWPLRVKRISVCKNTSEIQSYPTDNQTTRLEHRVARVGVEEPEPVIEDVPGLHGNYAEAFGQAVPEHGVEYPEGFRS